MNKRACTAISGVLIVAGVVGLLGCGRGRTPEATPPVQAPSRAQEAATVASSAQAEKAPPDASAQPITTPQPPSAGENQEASQEPRSATTAPWRIPDGPLDDAKFIVIAAKYTTASLALKDKGRADEETMRAVLEAILSEAKVSIEDFMRHAEAVASDARRTERVSAAIIRLAREHGADIDPE